MEKVVWSFCVTMTLILWVLIYLKQPDDTVLSPPRYTIGVVLKAMDSEHWLAVQSSMQKIAQERNLNLIILYPENESAWKQQNKIVMDLLDNGIDALIVSPTNIYETGDYLNKAEDKNIPVFFLDEKMPNIPYIGSDNYLIGQKAAMYMAQHLPEGSQVGIVFGSSNQDAHIQRMKGFVDYVTNHTSLRISACITNDMNYSQTTVQMENLLQQYPEIRGLFITNALMALSASEVTGNSSKHISIVGVDTQNDAIMALKNGKIDAMISQDGHETGTLVLDVVLNYLDNQQIVKEDNYIQNDLITKDNADSYLLQEDF